jgi:hypothetical protein
LAQTYPHFGKGLSFFADWQRRLTPGEEIPRLDPVILDDRLVSGN